MNTKNYFFITLCIYSIWIILNLFLMLHIDGNTRYAASADAGSWWNAGLNLFHNRSFEGLKGMSYEGIYRPPVIPIIIAGSLFFTKTESFIPFVFLQIIATIFTSIIIVKLMDKWPEKYRLLLLALFLFNPNIISTSQLIQSEIFTMLLFTISLAALLNYSNSNKPLINAALAGIFIGLATLSRPSIIFLTFMLPFSFMLANLELLKSNFNFHKLSVCLFHGIFSFVLSIIVILPWMTYVKSIEGEYSVTSAESRYRFVWDQSILVTTLSKNLSYKEAVFETEQSQQHQKMVKVCQNIKNNYSERAKCINNLTKEGYKIFFNNSFTGHSIALSRSLVQFFIAGGGQNFSNLLQPIIRNFDEMEWVNNKRRNTYLFNHENNFAFICTIITVTFALTMRFLCVFGIAYFCIRKKWSYLIILLGIFAYFALIHVYHGSSRYRIPIEPPLILVAVSGIYFLEKKFRNYKRKI